MALCKPCRKSRYDDGGKGGVRARVAYAAKPEQYRAHSRGAYAKDPDAAAKAHVRSMRRLAADPVAYRAEKMRWYRSLRARAFDKLGRVCVRCGFDDVRALQVDHVHGGGSRERAGKPRGVYLLRVLADETGKYQILCANCNWIKRRENAEECSGVRYPKP